MRPIDADYLKTKVHKVYGYPGKILEADLDNAPTLDVRPAKYTSWYVDEELYTHGECQCRSCGAIFNNDMIDSAYCPNCGAEVVDPEEELNAAD
ncbi:MAG: hypothetical protein PUF49_09870 [Firmicutes bacterium]|nr:hypothetical protein [Bacillota bacterium]